ncbi:probable calcium-binding protein CML43 [Cryptomeria japonica]|uniref:probable calcium-binding protein CML43 n=1 Tax=Cryptomeria japonica TaxID=3369 RepID=UPI0027D9F9C7|nr:probable calcium-binding protein CML43 [Cryptomeria japonica]
MGGLFGSSEPIKILVWAKIKPMGLSELGFTLTLYGSRKPNSIEALLIPTKLLELICSNNWNLTRSNDCSTVANPMKRTFSLLARHTANSSLVSGIRNRLNDSINSLKIVERDEKNKLRLWFLSFALYKSMANLDAIRRIYEIIDGNADGSVVSSLSNDEDKFNCVGFEEFVHLYQSIFSNEDAELEDESKDLMEAFKVFDRNEDGYISSTELQQVLSSLGLIAQGQHCENMICRFDSDCNGVLDFMEFKNMMASKLSS